MLFLLVSSAKRETRSLGPRHRPHGECINTSSPKRWNRLPIAFSYVLRQQLLITELLVALRCQVLLAVIALTAVAKDK